MKKLVLPVLLLAVGGYLAYANYGHLGLAGVPVELRDLIIALLTAGVGWLLMVVGDYLGVDLSGYKDEIVSLVSGVVLTVVEGWLGLIPTVYDDVVLAAIHLVVTIFALLGFFLLMRKRTKVQAFQ